MRWTRISKRRAASLPIAARLSERDFVADRTEYSFAVAAQPVSPDSLAAAGNVLVRTVHGSRMRTRATAFLELARAFDFPAGSGDNADALIDLLSDLEWLGEHRGYLMYIGDAARVLADEPEHLADWLTTIRYAQARWNDADHADGWSPRFRIVAVDPAPLPPAWAALGTAVALDG